MTQPGDPSNQPNQPWQPAPQQFGPPQGYQQQPQGYQQPAPQPPDRFAQVGTIELTLQGSPLTSNMLTPQVQIDGYPVPAAYGLNRLPIPAGRHTVSAYAQWLVKYGQASYVVDVYPGQSVPVFYVAPMMQFMKGSMGPTKQQRKGKSVFVVLILIVAVIVALAIIGSIAGSS